MTDNKIKKLCDLKWWGSRLKKSRIDTWIKNFGDKHYDVAWFLLNNIVFYNKDQINSLLHSFICNIQNDFYMETLKTLSCPDEIILKKTWRSHLEHIRFVPMKRIGESGESSDLLSRSLSQILEHHDSLLRRIDQIITINSLNDISSDIKKVYFINDFSGTGNQISEFLKQTITIDGHKKSVSDYIISRRDVSFEFAPLIMHKKALENHQNHSNIVFNPVEIIDEKMDLRSRNCVFYLAENDPNADRYHEYIKNKNDELLNTKNLKGLAKYQLGIPLVFEHGCPNNSLALFFADTKSWHNLFDRRQ